MKRTYPILVSLLLAANLSSAALNSDNNILGFYFDTAAESNCVETAAFATVPLYVVLTNPDMDTIYGYEFGYTASGSYFVSGTSFMGSGPIDVGGSQGNHIVGLASPLSTSNNTVLATLQVFVMDANQIRFDLHGSDPASVVDEPELPAVLLSDDVIESLALATSGNVPSARINGKCNPDIDEGSWDSVKSLYQ